MVELKKKLTKPKKHCTPMYQYDWLFLIIGTYFGTTKTQQKIPET